MKVVTAAIIRQGMKVLLTRRAAGETLAGMWEFPGGKQEGDETLEECLQRELLEELGLSAAVGSVVAESVYIYEHGAIRLVAMEAEILDGHPILTVHDRVEWVDPRELETYQLAPADVPIAKALQRQLAAGGTG